MMEVSEKFQFERELSQRLPSYLKSVPYGHILAVTFGLAVFEAVPFTDKDFDDANSEDTDFLRQLEEICFQLYQAKSVILVVNLGNSWEEVDDFLEYIAKFRQRIEGIDENLTNRLYFAPYSAWVSEVPYSPYATREQDLGLIDDTIQRYCICAAALGKPYWPNVKYPIETLGGEIITTLYRFKG